MAGLVPAIHAAPTETKFDSLGEEIVVANSNMFFNACGDRSACRRLLRNRSEMAGTSPAMTRWGAASRLCVLLSEAT
jgi:hypothetical protein